MIKYIAQRLFQSLVVLFGLSLLIFFIARIVPGDPARAALGSLASQEQIQKLRKQMHLDEPIPVQYYFWLKSVLRGDLGVSLYTQRPVTADLAKFLPATIELIVFATLISIVVGQVIGVFAGYFRNSWFDSFSRLISYVGVATPPFAVAIFLAFIFSYLLNLVPSTGRLSLTASGPPQVTGLMVIDSLIAGKLTLAWEALKHLLLPAASLSLANLAQEARITRTSLADNLQRDYVAAHKVYGISIWSITFKYLLRPSIVPTVSIMGLDFAFLLSNAFLVELVFVWPGFSRYAVTVMLNKDLNAIIAVVLIIGVTFAVVNLVVDILVAFLDPRIRLRRQEE